MCFHLSSQRKQQAALPCHAPSPQLCCTQSCCFEKQHGFVWITLLSFKGWGSRAPALAKLTDQLCLTCELQNLITTFHGLRGVKPPLTSTDHKGSQWEDEGAEMGSGISCRGLAWLLGDAEPSLLHHILQQLPPKSAWAQAGSNCCPHSFWQPRDALEWHGTLWPALIYKGNHSPA